MRYRIVFLCSIISVLSLRLTAQPKTPQLCDLPERKTCGSLEGHPIGRTYIVRFDTKDFQKGHNTLVPVVVFGQERLIAASILVRNTNGNNLDHEPFGFAPRATIVPMTANQSATGKIPNGASGLEPSATIAIPCVQNNGQSVPMTLKFNYGTYAGGDAVYVEAGAELPSCKIGLHIYAVTMAALFPGVTGEKENDSEKAAQATKQRHFKKDQGKSRR